MTLMRNKKISFVGESLREKLKAAPGVWDGERREARLTDEKVYR
jgi:hypothetical protein